MTVVEAGVHSEPTIAGVDIAKRFGHVEALRRANVAVNPGEVVAVVGDNGAGKSTLLKILLGQYRPDAGAVVIGGHHVELDSVRSAQRLGVECVHQDLSLAPDLSVVDNMFVGHELMAGGLLGRLGVMARGEMARRADEALKRLAITLPSLNVKASELSGGQRQAVAVARAVMWAGTALLLDEPTAALGARASDLVCQLIRTVAATGMGVLVVSHDLPRMLQYCDRIAVLWRGETVMNESSASLSVPEVVTAMVGYQSRSA